MELTDMTIEEFTSRDFTEETKPTVYRFADIQLLTNEIHQKVAIQNAPAIYPDSTNAWDDGTLHYFVFVFITYEDVQNNFHTVKNWIEMMPDGTHIVYDMIFDSPANA